MIKGYELHKNKVLEDAKIATKKHINSVKLEQLSKPKEKIEIKNEDMILWFMKQNPEKSSKWAQMAKEGHHVVQIIMIKPWFEYIGVITDLNNVIFYK